MTESRSLFASAGSGSERFERELQRLERRGDTDLARVDASVREVLAAVRQEGDRAVLRFVERFEGRRPDPLVAQDYGGEQALESLEPNLRGALETAARRIRRYHQRQAEDLRGFEYTDGGATLGSRVVPLRRVGVYAPGGKARYPSTVLMCAVIAQVAGVEEIVVACPDPCVEVRAACHLSGVQSLLNAGGAQAIAALAYGTESLPRVDKIVGPGNIYVTAAKRLVFGEVAIDSIAGPSEILVVADATADPQIVAADLLSQAEHDEAAYALLVTNSRDLLEAVRECLLAQLQTLPRRVIAETSLQQHGFAFVVDTPDQLVSVANRLAVEHVAVQTADARRVADAIQRAGALFVGPQTPEAAGDYLAGPSHVLPTGGAARFSSPLGVYDFVARSSVISYTQAALEDQADAITALARIEGLEAHARAVEARRRG